jgi:hypothetical protein
MESQYTGDDLDIKIDVNPNNSRSFELNNVNNIGVGTSSSINIHNIDVDTSSSTNKPVDDNDLDEYVRNNKEDEDNEVDFSLHDTPIDYLF